MYEEHIGNKRSHMTWCQNASDISFWAINTEPNNPQVMSRHSRETKMLRREALPEVKSLCLLAKDDLPTYPSSHKVIIS